MMEYAVIGEHLAHSYSREIHRELAPYSYVLHEVAPDDLEGFIRERNYKGLNVTIPYKKAVMPFLDSIDPVALKIGAVNTIVNVDGVLHGYNTDYYGMAALIQRIGISLKGKKVLIIGTGGTSVTARAIAVDCGARSVLRISRDPHNQDISYEQAYALHTDAEVIINTTPVGMYPSTNGLPLDLSRFPACIGVVDAIYNPLRTHLIQQAKQRRIPAEGGLYMLVAQAAKACALFLDDNSILEKTDRVYNTLYANKQNVVLIGMPSSGKSTVGKLLSERMGRTFTDTDSRIEERAGTTISAIFASQGEAAFRHLERECIAACSQNSQQIIATGGGAVMDADNVSNLRMNGVLILLDRPLESLTATKDRPLSSDREMLEKRYRERMPLYRSIADYIVSGDTPQDVVNHIERLWNECAY